MKRQGEGIENVQDSNDQEKAQERNSHSKNRGWRQTELTNSNTTTTGLCISLVEALNLSLIFFLKIIGHVTGSTRLAYKFEAM